MDQVVTTSLKELTDWYLELPQVKAKNPIEGIRILSNIWAYFGEKAVLRNITAGIVDTISTPEIIEIVS